MRRKCLPDNKKIQTIEKSLCNNDLKSQVGETRKKDLRGCMWGYCNRKKKERERQHRVVVERKIHGWRDRHTKTDLKLNVRDDWETFSKHKSFTKKTSLNKRKLLHRCGPPEIAHQTDCKNCVKHNCSNIKPN